MLLGRSGGLIDDGGLVVVPRRQVQPQSLLLNNILRPQVLDVSPQARALTEDKVRQLFVVQDQQTADNLKIANAPASAIQDIVKRKQEEAQEIVKIKEEEAKKKIDSIVQIKKDYEAKKAEELKKQKELEKKKEEDKKKEMEAERKKKEEEKKQKEDEEKEKKKEQEEKKKEEAQKKKDEAQKKKDEAKEKEDAKKKQEEEKKKNDERNKKKETDTADKIANALKKAGVDANESRDIMSDVLTGSNRHKPKNQKQGN